MQRSGEFDVIVAGGGVAGAAVAAALDQFDYRVAVVEPGMDASRRLAGELAHPPGAAALQELGLLAPLATGQGTPIAGFSIYFDGAAESRRVVLPYGGTSAGLAMEHGLIRERALAAVSQLRRVTLLEQARITAVDLGSQDSARVTVTSRTGDARMNCRMLVAADGASSHVSLLAGMPRPRRRVSTLVGALLGGAELPDRGYGHVFLGGRGPVLAYPISGDAVRVMFDVPCDSADAARTGDTAYRDSLHALPAPFREEVIRGLNDCRTISSASYNMPVREVTRGRLVLVGDAAGCCHPLTATGLTVCARDALRLRDALRAAGGDIARALELYARRRRAPQRTRLVIASALYEIFCGQTPELRLLRDGLRESLRNSRHRDSCMALLSTEDGRLRRMLFEMMRVLACGLGARTWNTRGQGIFQPDQTRVLLDLSRLVLRHAGEALRTS